MKTHTQTPNKSGPRRQLHILVIDDESALREIIRLTLETEGHEVLEAASGEEGKALAQRIQPDLIVCDVNMPGLSGHDVLRALRNNGETHGIPFIFLTACREAQSIRQGMAGGASEYLIKPFRPEELLEAVSACAEKLIWFDEDAAPVKPVTGSG